MYVYCVIVLVKLIVENEGVNDILVIEFVCLFYDIVDEKVVDVNKLYVELKLFLFFLLLLIED